MSLNVYFINIGDGPNMTIAEITIDKSNHDPNLDSLIFSNVSIVSHHLPPILIVLVEIY